MDSRKTILNAIRRAQPPLNEHPGHRLMEFAGNNCVEIFQEVLAGVGGKTYVVSDVNEIDKIIGEIFPDIKRTVYASAQPGIIKDGHSCNDVDLFIFESRMAVAENGAVWITDKDLPLRVLPFIAQHLAVMISKDAIVDTMHHAYEFIEGEEYGYGCFIAGPSKTADIEQSLVLGAHGALSMTAFLLDHHNIH